MTSKNYLVVATLMFAPFVYAASGKSGGNTNPPPTVLGPPEIRVSKLTIPADATAQFALSLTEPTPIITGTGQFEFGFMMDGIFGASVTSPAGDAYGVASLRNGKLNLNVVSPLGSLGTVVDYPIITLTTHVSATALPGSTAPVGLSSSTSFLNPLGSALPMVYKPGSLTVGGALSVHNVIPGGGTWPAGTVIRIVGTGFTRSTTIRSKFRIKSYQVLSPTDIAVILDRATTMDSQEIDLTNPDKSTVTYYSYLRGVESAMSKYDVVASAETLYSGQTYSSVALQQNSTGFSGTVLTALSIQNPNPTDTKVKIEAENALGKIGEFEITLAFGQKLTRELGELFGRTLEPGTTVKVVSTLPLQVLGFTADTSTGALAPFMPVAF